MILFSDLSQCWSIPFSFISFALASIKLFYLQRLGRFADHEPSLKMCIFIFPFIVGLVAGPLFSLVLIATYFQGYAIVCVALIMLANFVALNFIYLNGKQIAGVLNIQTFLVSHHFFKYNFFYFQNTLHKQYKVGLL